MSTKDAMESHYIALVRAGAHGAPEARALWRMMSESARCAVLEALAGEWTAREEEIATEWVCEQWYDAPDIGDIALLLARYRKELALKP